MTKDQFVEKARLIHGDKYDYSLTEYKSSKTKVKIICKKCGSIFEQTPDKHINSKSGCKDCVNEQLRKDRAIGKEEFIRRSKLVHGDKYDYSLVEYKNGRTKVKIFCKDCGVYFYQFAQNHMLGSGHKSCSLKNEKINLQQFIKKAKKVHGDKYDYSLVEYKNTNTSISIICKKCGNVFSQRPINHLKGSGCGNCQKNCKLTTEQFIENAKKVHGDEYDYSLVEYKNSRTKVKIICKKHGVFYQSYNTHVIQGCRCKKCVNEEQAKLQQLTIEQFVERSKLIHGDKYDYSLVEYKGARTKVKIFCRKCGIYFNQIAYYHLAGHGCKYCIHYLGEEKIKSFLNRNEIVFESQKTFPGLIDEKSLSYDFYIPSKNLLVEYNGEQHYEPVEIFGGKKKFLLQQKHDKMKEEYAKNNNINLLVIPYWDYNKIEEILGAKL